MMNSEVYARIYKLTSRNTQSVYINYTMSHLCTRLSRHRSIYQEHLEGKLPEGETCPSWEVMCHGSVDISLVEEGLYSSLHELKQRTAHFQRDAPNCVNTEPSILPRYLTTAERNRDSVRRRTHEQRRREPPRTPSQAIYRQESRKGSVCEQCGGRITGPSPYFIEKHEATLKHQRSVNSMA